MIYLNSQVLSESDCSIKVICGQVDYNSEENNVTQGNSEDIPKIEPLPSPITLNPDGKIFKLEYNLNNF